MHNANFYGEAISCWFHITITKNKAINITVGVTIRFGFYLYKKSG